AVGADNEKVAPLEPVIETIESVPARLGLAAQIATEDGHGDVAAETPARGPTERDTLSRYPCSRSRRTTARPALEPLSRGARPARPLALPLAVRPGCNASHS